VWDRLNSSLAASAWSTASADNCCRNGLPWGPLPKASCRCEQNSLGMFQGNIQSNSQHRSTTATIRQPQLLHHPGRLLLKHTPCCCSPAQVMYCLGTLPVCTSQRPWPAHAVSGHGVSVLELRTAAPLLSECGAACLRLAQKPGQAYKQ
jgi:hypothetical protein